eukprot:CAMPEP_0175085890 /NCGR_PEP_ID=MMETSP0052_2-20121109/28929_1 /TAXON_ID=51329 ORGANISM="Polytomella parva, Strain SAG 63-3" /NCGR_SAMPLE_ID=MMETSP0052_2 /ASSEMBLY_ACC=CAM_ASM_000194 /LENGTH=1046 /DNA_ID=CAMNT_0016357981 /DNA_START=457 /DNA_END=3595 /DNA_ORIENTATION=+
MANYLAWRHLKASWVTAASQHSRKWGKRRVFLAWKRALASAAAMKMLMEAVKAYHRDRLKRRLLQEWKAVAHLKMTKRAAALAALATAAAGIAFDLAKAVIASWREWAVDKTRRRRKERFAQAYLRRWRQLVVMWSWRRTVAEEKRLRFAEKKLRECSVKWRLSIAFSQWHFNQLAILHQNTTSQRTHVLLKSTLHTFRRFVSHRRNKLLITAECVHVIQTLRKRQCFRLWREGVDQQLRERGLWLKAEGFFRKKTLSHSLNVWRLESERLVTKRRNYDVAAQMHRTKTLVKSLEVLRNYAKLQGLGKTLTAIHIARQRGKWIQEWKKFAERKARNEMLRRKAVRHRYLHLLRVGLRGFKAHVARADLREEIWAKISEERTRSALADVVQAWASLVIPASYEMRELADLAAKGHDARWRRKCLTEWQRITRERRRRQTIGDEVRDRIRLRRQGNVMTAWRYEAQRRAKKHRERDHVVAAAHTLLIHSQRQRVFAAWKLEHLRRLSKLEKMAAAEQVWRVKVLSETLHVFRRYRDRRLSKKAVAATRRRLADVLRRLVDYAHHQQWKRQAYAAAARHHRRQQLTSALKALGWYAKRRQAKHAAMACAQKMWIHKLRSEGAVAWLAVGLERRRHRLEMLATHQAKILTDQLTLVEPYARKWRSISQQRRRSRVLNFATSSSYCAASSFSFPFSYPLALTSSFRHHALPAPPPLIPFSLGTPPPPPVAAPLTSLGSSASGSPSPSLLASPKGLSSFGTFPANQRQRSPPQIGSYDTTRLHPAPPASKSQPSSSLSPLSLPPTALASRGGGAHAPLSTNSTSAVHHVPAANTTGFEKKNDWQEPETSAEDSVDGVAQDVLPAQSTTKNASPRDIVRSSVNVRGEVMTMNNLNNNYLGNGSNNNDPLNNFNNDSVLARDSKAKRTVMNSHKSPPNHTVHVFNANLTQEEEHQISFSSRQSFNMPSNRSFHPTESVAASTTSSHLQSPLTAATNRFQASPTAANLLPSPRMFSEPQQKQQQQQQQLQQQLQPPPPPPPPPSPPPPPQQQQQQ